MAKAKTGKQPELLTQHNIKIVGIGSGAINAINHMIDCGMQEADFIAVSCHSSVLHFSKTHNIIDLTNNRTLGLGMIRPEFSHKCAEELSSVIEAKLRGVNVVFLIACMGGGTASGASSVVAACARKLGALTIAVATKPFTFEGRRRRMIAEKYISELKKNVDGFILISDDYLLHTLDKKIHMMDAFRVVDDSIRQCVQSVSDMLSIPGLMNIKFKKINLPLSNSNIPVDKDKALMVEILGPKCNQEVTEDLMPRSDGKKVCSYLRSIRIRLAKANNIPFESEPCTFNGECAGTCEKCDHEAAYLRDELNKIPEENRKYPKQILSDWKKEICSEK